MYFISTDFGVDWVIIYKVVARDFERLIALMCSVINVLTSLY